MEALGDLPGGAFHSDAFSASSDGSVIVGLATSDRGTEAFRWTRETGMVGLGALSEDPYSSLAFDLNSDGTIIVGGSKTGPRTSEAFIWDSVHGLRRLRDVLTQEYGLDLVGWELSGALGISDDGRAIAGNGINPDGDYEAWIAILPEPETGAVKNPVPTPSSSR